MQTGEEKGEGRWRAKSKLEVKLTCQKLDVPSCRYGNNLEFLMVLPHDVQRLRPYAACASKETEFLHRRVSGIQDALGVTQLQRNVL